MKNKALPTLFFTIFLDMVGVGILIPVIPVLLADPASPHYLLPFGTPRETGYVLLGIMIAAWSFGQFLAAPIIGQLSDRYGRKKLLIISIIGSIFGHALFATGIYLKSILLLFVVRIFAGVMAGNIVVSQAAIADITTPENRAKNFGLIGAAFGLGFIVGPLLGGKLADASIVSWFTASTPFWFAAALSILNLFFVMMMFKETNSHMKEKETLRFAKALTNIVHAWNAEKLRPLFTTSFLYQAGFSFYMTFANVFLFYRFGFTESSIGNYFAYIGMWIVFTQAVVTRFANKRWGEAIILQNSIIAAGLSILAIFLSPQAAWLYFIVPFMAFAVGLTNANLSALLSRSAGPAMQGEVLGINGSVNALAMTIPPLLAGPIAARFEPATPLIVASMVIIFGGLYFIDHIRRGKQLSS